MMMEKETYDMFVSGYVRGKWDRGWDVEEGKYHFHVTMDGEDGRATELHVSAVPGDPSKNSIVYRDGKRHVGFRDNAEIEVTKKSITFKRMSLFDMDIKVVLGDTKISMSEGKETHGTLEVKVTDGKGKDRISTGRRK